MVRYLLLPCVVRLNYLFHSSFGNFGPVFSFIYIFGQYVFTAFCGFWTIFFSSLYNIWSRHSRKVSYIPLSGCKSHPSFHPPCSAILGNHPILSVSKTLPGIRQHNTSHCDCLSFLLLLCFCWVVKYLSPYKNLLKMCFFNEMKQLNIVSCFLSKTEHWWVYFSVRVWQHMMPAYTCFY